MERELRHECQWTWEQSQFKKQVRDPRDQHQFTLQEIHPKERQHRHRHVSTRKRERRHKYESRRQGRYRNHQDQLTRTSRNLRSQDQFTTQEIDPRFIDIRPRERREARHLARERRNGSNRRRRRSRSRSIDRKQKRTKIEEIEINQENVGTNWFDLPRDVMLLILSKVGVIEILLTLPLVCSLWRDLAKGPLLFRSVVLSEDDDHLRGKRMAVCRIVRKAAAMSCGSMVEFWCSNMSYVFVPQLQCLTTSGSSLKSLRLGRCSNLDITSVVEVVKCLPSLEDIYLNNPCCPKGALDVIGNSCPNLKFVSFGIICLKGHRAFSIANTMPGLRRLCLRGNNLTREGLQAILDGCRYLEYVHVKGFSNIKKLEGGYAKRYQCKSYVKDYERGIEIWELELKLNDDCRPSMVGPSNGYEYSSLPFEDPYPTPFCWVDDCCRD